eukprot:gene8375-9274_t
MLIGQQLLQVNHLNLRLKQVLLHLCLEIFLSMCTDSPLWMICCFLLLFRLLLGKRIQIVVDPFCSRPKECLNEEELIEEQKVVQQKKIDVALIKRGYTHIQEKIQEIRQKFSEAVTSGQRSGSGKIVLEFYDQLVQLWGGSPATEPLPSGVSTHGIDKGLPTNAVVDGGGNIDEELGTTLQEDVEIEEEPSTSKLNAKRKSTSPIPQLIDEERKHKETKCSSERSTPTKGSQGRCTF